MSNFEKQPTWEISSSSSSSDDDDMIIAVGAYLHYEEEMRKQMMCLLQLSQAATPLPPSTSRPRAKRRRIRRDREAAHDRLYKDYFAEDSVYNEHQFRRRFRMRRHLFLRIVEALGNHSEFFQLRYDCIGQRGLSLLTKCTAAMRMLAYGIVADCVDEYMKIGATIALECMKNFAIGVIEVFGNEYLRKPTKADVHRSLQVAEVRDFPGMLGTIDCMHWEWKNCPASWKASFQKKLYKVPTIILEAVASYDLWIWHAFFGLPGSLNDINILDRSPVFQELYDCLLYTSTSPRD